jgi:drug/metabolite transporter (DMT)-like permease
LDHSNRPTSPASPLTIWAALLTVYFVWGSTYLGIAVAIETMPPFVMLAIRFAIGGALLLGWEVLRGGASFRWPSRREWRDASIVGALLLGVGNGFVGFSEQTVASGIAATLIAMIPVWLVVFGWLYFRERLPALVGVGVAVGFAGVALLVWPVGAGANHFDPLAIGLLLLAPIGWSHGTLFAARRASLPTRSLTNTAVQMLAGSALLAVEAAVTGEIGRFHPEAISGRSLVALAYLTVVGSMLAYNAYAWLIGHAPLSLVGTYAYVNPVVAVALGALILSEPITPRTLLASAVIVVAVAMIVTARSRQAGAPEAREIVEGEAPIARVAREEGSTP